MRFRPYLQVDFRREPALHCLLFDNPAELSDLIRRGLELAMAERNLEYLDPGFQQKFAAKASGLSGGSLHSGTQVSEAVQKVTLAQPLVPTIEERKSSPSHLEDVPVAAKVLGNEPPTQIYPTQPNRQDVLEKPKPPSGISNFLSKAIADGQ